jgi:pimeloyl-ACP methyl ester carboxylesterase
VVLLHGFPEFWYSWRFQIPALAGAGFRVVAPDMRGYNLRINRRASKPRTGPACAGRGAPDRVLGERRAAVVGHDWGGMVAWAVAMLHPGRVERLAILNVPHPERFSRAVHPAPAPQELLSAPFQGPLAPREGPPGGRIRPPALRLPQRDPVRPGAFGEGDIDRYVEALSRPGALTAAINYYRALARQTPALVRALPRPIEAPVLVIWGERDASWSRNWRGRTPRWSPTPASSACQTRATGSGRIASKRSAPVAGFPGALTDQSRGAEKLRCSLKASPRPPCSARRPGSPRPDPRT